MATHYNMEYNKEYPKYALIQDIKKMKKCLNWEIHTLSPEKRMCSIKLYNSSYNANPIDPFKSVQNKIGVYKLDYKNFFMEQPYSKNSIAE